MSETLLVVCAHCDSTNRVPRQRLRDGGKCGVCHRPLFTGQPLTLNDAGRFAKHAQNGDLPLLVDFWAEWCGPCHAMAPIFEQAAASLEPEIRLARVDTEAARHLAERFAIRSLPTLLLIRHGSEIARIAGAMPLPRLIAWARQHADNPAA